MSIPTTALAAVRVEPGKPLDVIPVQVPDKLEPGAILVKTLAATVCATDVHLSRAPVGTSEAPPVILGHEMVGEVVRVGDGVDRDSIGQALEIGDRIIWTHGFCGQCFNCTVRHEPTLCTHRRAYMATPYTEYPYLTGGFAEYCYVFPSSGRVKVPAGISDEVASASSCALRTIMHGFKRLGPVDDAVVVIQGAGPLGLFAAAKAVTANARNVVVIGGPEARLQLAQKWGADEIINVGEVQSPEARIAKVQELTEAVGADVVIEVSGAASAFDEGMGMLRAGGRYLLIGQIGPHQTTISPSTFVLRQLSIIGSLSGSVEDYYHGLAFLERYKDRFAWDDMISAVHSIDDISSAMDAMASLRAIKPAIRFDV